MMRLQNNFTGGRWSPLLDARSDLAKYGSACWELSNFYTLPYGGVQYRGGTEFVSEIAPATRVIAFQRSDRSGLFLCCFSPGRLDVVTRSGKVVFSDESSPYLSSDIGQIQALVLNDVVLFFCAGVAPMRLEYLGEDSFWFGVQVFDPEPFLEEESGRDLQKSLTEDDSGLMLLPPEAPGTSVVCTFFFDAAMYSGDFSGHSNKQLRDFYDCEALGSERKLPRYFLRVEPLENKGGKSKPPVPGADPLNVLGVGVPLSYQLVAVSSASPGVAPPGGGGSGLSPIFHFIQHSKDQFAAVGLFSDFLFCFGTWTFSTDGFWNGTYEVWVYSLLEERQGWEKVRTVSGDSKNFTETGEFLDPVFVVIVFIPEHTVAGENGGPTWVFNCTGGRSVVSFKYLDAGGRVESPSPMIPALLGQQSVVWARSVFNEGNHPGCAAFFEQRLWLSGFGRNRNLLVASQTDDFFNFSSGDKATDALTYVVASNRQDRVLWLSASTSLVMGTGSNIFVVESNSLGEAVTSTNVRVRMESAISCGRESPLLCEKSLILTNANGLLFSMTPNTLAGNYDVVEVSLLSRDLFECGVLDMVRTQVPENRVYVLLGDGKLAVLTYDPGQSIVSWSVLVTKGAIISICNLSSSGHDVFLTVERGGRTVLERLTLPTDSKNTGVWLDCSVTLQDSGSGFYLSGDGKTILPGLQGVLNVLRGSTVSVAADGRYYVADITPAGRLVFANNFPGLERVRRLSVGLPYEGRLRTMKSDALLHTGGSQSRQRRISGLYPRFHRSYGGRYGPDWSRLSNIDYRTVAATPEVSDAMDATPAEFSGDCAVAWQPGHNRDGSVCILQDTPAPMILLSLTSNLEYY